MIEKEQERFRALLATVDKTLEELRKGTAMVTEKEMYEGFTMEQAAGYRVEAEQRWGKRHVEQSEQRVRSLTKKEWEDFRKRGDELHRRLAALMESDPASAEVQRAVREHWVSINFFYDVTEKMYRGLAAMYVEDPRFTAFYDRCKPGLAQFLSGGMLIYCDNGMRVR